MRTTTTAGQRAIGICFYFVRRCVVLRRYASFSFGTKSLLLVTLIKMVIMTQFEVWAQISLTAEDTQHIQNFFEVDFGIRHKFVARHPHLTVYHARRPMPGLRPSCENIHIVVPTSGTRFMILAPGGENPRPELDPGILKVGIRIQRQNPAMVRILEIRHRLTAYETADVLGKRAPSTDKRNAFGARTFQPHVALLRAGSRIDRDLTRVGQRFHEQISELRFDIFAIDIVKSKPANINRA